MSVSLSIWNTTKWHTHTQITSNNHPYIDICINKIKPSKNIYKQDRWPPNKKRKPPTVPHHPHHEHHEQALLDSTRSTWWLPSLNNLEAVSQLSIQSLNLKSHKLQQIRGDIGLNFSQQYTAGGSWLTSKNVKNICMFLANCPKLPQTCFLEAPTKTNTDKKHQKTLWLQNQLQDPKKRFLFVYCNQKLHQTTFKQLDMPFSVVACTTKNTINRSRRCCMVRGGTNQGPL